MAGDVLPVAMFMIVMVGRCMCCLCCRKWPDCALAKSCCNGSTDGLSCRPCSFFLFFDHLYPHLFIEMYEEMVKVEHSSKGHKNIHQIRGPSLSYQLAIVGFTSWNPLSRPRGTCCSRHCPLVPWYLAQHLRNWRSYFHHCYPGHYQLW